VPVTGLILNPLGGLVLEAMVTVVFPVQPEDKSVTDTEYTPPAVAVIAESVFELVTPGPDQL
jgi:hypothetical protein